jgi:sugar phosphate isomerase/epimerase
MLMKWLRLGSIISGEGMATGLHNHSGEFKMLDGQLIYDGIMEALDGNLVKMQFQTEVINLGYKGSTYFKKYPGRFVSAHLSDWTADKKQVPVGKGIIDWKEFFEDAIKIGGIKNFFVEMNQENYQDSASYIHELLG